MKLCIRTDACGNDPERVAQYCIGLGEDQVWAFPELAGGYGQDGLMQPARLQAYREQLRGHGLDLRLVTETLGDEDVASQQGRRAKVARICSVLTAMQAAEVESLFVVVTVRAADGEAERKAQWTRLGEIYREIADHAEATGRRLASHGHQTPEYLVFSAADMERLLSLAPSESNGVTFCTGCYQIAGDDLCGWVERFGKERIFLVHARDVRRQASGGFEDCRYGEGEVDLKAVVSRLKAIGYRGLVCPEHLPRLAHDQFDEISTAWGLGYLRALLAD